MARAACLDFDESLEHVAYSTVDSLLRIWEIDTGRLKQDYLPSTHLSASCTCLKWRPKNTLVPLKKKKTKSSQASQDDIELVALGTATGTVSLYNVSKGNIQTQLDGVHSTAVTDICWSNDGFTLYSCCIEGMIAQWDIKTATCTKKWKASTAGLTSLNMCGPSHIVAAGRSVTIWDVENDIKEKTIIGHSTDIIQTHVIHPDKSDTNADNVYIVTLAQDDRIISVWVPSQRNKKTRKAKMSFILNNEPVWSSLSYHEDANTIHLMVVTTAGTVEMFEHQLNGSVKKPIQPTCCIRVATAAKKKLPIMGCQRKSQILIIYGTPECPAFDYINTNELLDSEVTLVREEPGKSAPVTLVTSTGTVKQPKLDMSVTTLTPAVEGGRKMAAKKSKTPTSEKRSLEEPEISLEERLALLQGTNTKVQDSTGPVDSLTVLLTQGLQSDDSSILNKVLQTSDPRVVSTTVRKLPATCVLPLMRHLTLQLEKYGSGSTRGGVVTHTALVKWVRALLHIHASYLATFPELMERLKGMYNIMENRIGQLSTFTRLQGRLELMLSQIARQKDDETDAVPSAALLTLQDESSEDEMYDNMEMLGAHSESEDGYLSADEEELVK